MKATLLISFLFAAQCFAQQINPTITNYLESSDYRELDGVTYNIQKSDLWVEKSGKCDGVKSNGIILQIFIEERVYAINRPAVPPSYYERANIGIFAPSASVSSPRTVIGTNRTPDRRIFVLNPPEHCAVGQNITVVAMKTGTIDIDGEMLEKWDRGRPGKMKIVSANPAYTKKITELKRDSAKAKAVDFNRLSAEKGDAFGQFRMGERYRDGDGVPKDPTKAREFFEKAAAQGHSEAKAALEKMNGR